MSARTELGKVAVLYGGTSSERTISCQSGQAVLRALTELEVVTAGFDTATDFLTDLCAWQPDRVFIALHGRGGEDGQLQALLAYHQLPFTGSGVASSAIAMDKRLSKRIWQGMGLPTPKWQEVDATSEGTQVLHNLGGQVVIKPAAEGSSLGIHWVDNVQQWPQALADALSYNSPVMAEQFIVGHEYTVAIVAQEPLPVIRMRAASGYYDYAAKYERNDTHYHLPCGLSARAEQRLQELALDAFNTLGCRGWGRIDVMADAAGQFYLLEVNTVPGLTDHSLVPKAAAAAGLSFNQLIARLCLHAEVTP